MSNNSDGRSSLATGKGLARKTLAFVAVGALANLVFNMFIASKGLGAPYDSELFGLKFNSPLYDGYDRFADTLKMAMSYPGPPVHGTDPRWGLFDRIAAFDYQLSTIRGGEINPLHMLPLSTLMGLGMRAAVSAMDPAWVLLIGLMTCAGALTAVVVAASPPGSRWAFGASALVSYPALFAFDRGHLFSLICGAALMAATFRCLRDRKIDATTLLMFAVAINIRPNVGIIPCGLFLCSRGVNFKDLIKLGVASLIIFAAGMVTANAIFPDYNMESWLQGLSDYSKANVAGNLGQTFNSSLYGSLRGLYGYHQWTVLTPIGVLAALIAGISFLGRRKKVPDSVLIFVLLAAYALGGQVFLDYHLIVFLLPVLLLAWEPRVDPFARAMVVIGSCLVLIPKNYLSHATDGKADWSFQIIINPAVLLLTAFFLLYHFVRGGAETNRHAGGTIGGRAVAP